MQCPECGYVLSAFDKECSRCKNFAEKGIPIGKVAQGPPTVEEPLPQPMWVPPPATEYAPPEPELSFAPTDAVYTRSRTARLPSDILHCPICGHEDTRKVSAIVQEGSWTEHTTGQVNTHGQVWEGPMYLSQGFVNQQTRGASGLAQTLAPPPRPSHPEISGVAIFVGIVAIIIGGLTALVSLPFCIILIGFPFLAMGFFGMGAGVYVLIRYFSACSKRQVAEANMPAWLAVMDNWNRLFYCRRCDYVFDPATGRALPSNQMYGLM